MEQNEINMYRHSLAHVLAKAVQKLYPGVLLTIGPSIDDGFYYDFDIDGGIKFEDRQKIEKEMQKIISHNEKFERKELSKIEALELFIDNKYKTEIINELPENEIISVYFLGDDFVDLCRGPHVEHTGKLSNWAYKINRVSGAYWRGDEKNKMLYRVYAYAFPTRLELEEYEKKVADAIARDHNKIGRELRLFTTVPMIGQGLPILLPKGAKVIQLLQRFVEDEEEKRGYLLTKTPVLAKSDLYKISGHWDHYQEGMFILGDPKNEGKEDVYALRPMTCPFQYQCYLTDQRSYKDLPLRYNETSTLFRKESSGEMHGLIRLSQFTISEGHIVCTPEQVEEEFKGCVDLAKYIIGVLGFDKDVSYRFSKWDKNNREKYIGTEDEWESTQDMMREILSHLGISFVEADGEAAFYGPKLDIQMKNVFGKEDTIITIQIDFQLAKKFGMEFVDRDGIKKTPYILHRTSLGCYERTLAYLIEKTAGALPVWLSPEQVAIIPVSEKSIDYSKKVEQQLRQAGFRIKTCYDDEKLGYKIRQSQMNKIPYMVILGENESESGLVSIRKRGNIEIKDIKTQELIDMINEDIKEFK